jgi:hypothetical protein
VWLGPAVGGALPCAFRVPSQVLLLQLQRALGVVAELLRGPVQEDPIALQVRAGTLALQFLIRELAGRYASFLRGLPSFVVVGVMGRQSNQKIYRSLTYMIV